MSDALSKPAIWFDLLFKPAFCCDLKFWIYRTYWECWGEQCSLAAIIYKLWSVQIRERKSILLHKPWTFHDNILRFLSCFTIGLYISPVKSALFVYLLTIAVFYGFSSALVYFIFWIQLSDCATDVFITYEKVIIIWFFSNKIISLN